MSTTVLSPPAAYGKDPPSRRDLLLSSSTDNEAFFHGAASRKTDQGQSTKKPPLVRKESTVMDFRESETPWYREVEEAVVTFCIMHYMVIFWLIVLGLALLWRNGIKWPMVILASLYVPFYLVPWQRIGGRYSSSLAQRPFWRRMQRHLKVQVEREVELDPSKQYIFGFHPHGILLLSRVAIYGGVWETLFPGIEIRTLAASPLFLIPPIREITILLGGVDAGRSYAERVLRDGYSVSVYPGGSKEIFTTDPSSPATHLVLKDRKGFIKLALKHGTPLVPVYVWGEKYAYDKLEKSGFSRWLLKTFRIPFLVFWGRWYSMMPKKGTSLAVVVGEPMQVPTVESPNEELVNLYHSKYIQEVQNLFNRHKAQYGQPGEYLVIE